MNKNKILKAAGKILFCVVLLVALVAISAPVKTTAKNNDEIKMKVFVHYPKADIDQEAGKGKPQKPSCQITANDQIPDYGFTGWKLPAGTISYQVNYGSRPSNLSLDNVKVALDNSFQVWVATGTPNFVEGSPVSIGRYQMDGVNLVAWGTVPSGAIAVTYTWYYSGTGQWVESDTIMNRRLKWAWTAYAGDCAGAAGAYDVQNIMTHENGHWMGLDDLYAITDKDLTMYGYGVVAELKKDTLGLGDTLGIDYLY